MKTATKIIIAGASAAAIIAAAGSGKKGTEAKGSPRNKRFLFIGDSLTLGFGLDNFSYVDKLKEWFPGLVIKKIAVTGKQTGWMLQELQKELATGNKYDVITIWGGVNDIYAKKSIDETKKNLQNMYDLAKSAGAKVVALTTIPTRTYKISSSVTSGLTKMLDQWLKSNSSIDQLVDVNALVNDGKDGTKPEYLQKDHLHLSLPAQENIAKIHASKLSIASGLGYVKKGKANVYNAAKSKALALEIELDLLQLDQPGIELKYNRNIKASVAEAIKQLIEHGSFKGYSPMAIQVLYSSFKDVEGEVYDEADGEEKMIDVTDEKSLQYAMLKQAEKLDLVHSYYSDDRFTLTPEGQRVIDSINARLETLKAKKRGSDLFPGMMGINSIHPKIKFVSAVSTIGNTETKETLVEKKLQEAQSKKKFKDSGTRVKGSKKEQAAIRGLITISDLAAIEQDEVTAFEMVVKDKVWKKIDLEQRNDIESGALYLIRELRSAYAGKPKQKTAAMRKSYVVLATYFQAEFDKVKTVDQLKEFADNFYKINALEAVKIYLPDEAYLFSDPSREAELTKRFNVWQVRSMLKEVAGKEFYNLLFRYNSEAAVTKWMSAKKFSLQNDWSWCENKKTTGVKKSELTINTGLPLSYIKRIGGLVVSDVSEKFIINTLGFKYLEFGNYVRDTEANEHLRHFIGAYVDLCDILNINAKQITQLNNLSIAFGSRGKAGAMAFYQPGRQIIALTKKRGDGTVAHEWFHYLDHLVFKNVSSGDSFNSLFSGDMKIKSNDFKALKGAFENILQYIQKASYKDASGTLVHVKKEISELTTTETYFAQTKYRYNIPIKNTIEETLAAFKLRYPSFFTTRMFRKDKTKKIFGFIAQKFGFPIISIEVKHEIESSMYYHYSSQMSSKYWIQPEELFARAFETYMFDKLEEKGRFNNYLVSGDSFDSPYKIYPYGKDREILFMLFENLFAELRAALSLNSFEEFTENRADEYINFDEKKEEETVSSGVIVETSAKAKALALELELELLSI